MPKGKVRQELETAERHLMRALMEAHRCCPNATEEIEDAIECIVAARVWVQEKDHREV